MERQYQKSGTLLALAVAISGYVCSTKNSVSAAIADTGSSSDSEPKDALIDITEPDLPPTIQGTLPPVVPTEPASEAVDEIVQGLKLARDGDAEAADKMYAQIVEKIFQCVDIKNHTNEIPAQFERCTAKISGGYGITDREFRIFKTVSGIDDREKRAGQNCDPRLDSNCWEEQSHESDLGAVGLLNGLAQELPDGPFDPLLIKLLGLKTDDDLRNFAAEKLTVVPDWDNPLNTAYDTYKAAYGISAPHNLPK